MTNKNAPENGSPRPAALEAMRQIYGEGQTPTPEVYLEEGAFEGFEETEEPAKLPKDRSLPVRLVKPVERPTRLCHFSVNEVEFSIPIVDISITDHAICMLAPEEEYGCTRIPISRDVQIEIEGKRHRVCYMGGLHRFRSSNLKVLWFVKTENPENNVDPAAAVE